MSRCSSWSTPAPRSRSSSRSSSATPFCQNSLAGVQGAWFSELFAAKTRTTGASLAYQLSAVVSGFTPLVATALFAGVGWIGPALLFSGYGLLGLIAALVTRETWGRAERAEVAALEAAPCAAPVQPQPRSSRLHATTGAA